ncbi:hypothetical protein [Arthrobacter rhombi]|uniref:hypothetical protein n=1 Tax=Arthrobacter rhombi TaxID=71253 RepID=UPI003FCF3080
MERRKSNHWNQQVRSRIWQLEVTARWIKELDPVGLHTGPEGEALRVLDEGITGHLEAARNLLDERPLLRSAGTIAVGSALARVHAADELLLRRGSDEYVRGQLADIQADAKKHLASKDPRRLRLEAIIGKPAAPAVSTGQQKDAVEDPVEGNTNKPARKQERKKAASGDSGLGAEARESIIVASAAAHQTYRREFSQLRNFRHVLFGTTALLIILAVGVGLWGYAHPKELSPCFATQKVTKVVCPTQEITMKTLQKKNPAADVDDALKKVAQPFDVALIEAIGLVAAAVSGATSLRRVSGTSTPYSPTLALAIMKLPVGALTAMLGLMLMRGGFVPGLTALDTSAQILAWAIVFGAAQQLVTGLVDRQAKGVVDNVGGKTLAEVEGPATP